MRSCSRPRRARLLRLWTRGTPAATLAPQADGLLARRDAAAATRALETLSPMQRACFELVVLRQLSAKEVAAMHGIAESTVRQHVFRARAALREVLNDDA